MFTQESVHECLWQFYSNYPKLEVIKMSFNRRTDCGIAFQCDDKKKRAIVNIVQITLVG